MKRKLADYRKRKGIAPVVQQRGVVQQPDRDCEALKACCKALESCSCPRMVKATLDFVNSKYAPPGAA